MRRLSLPIARVDPNAGDGRRFDIPRSALARWDPQLRIAAGDRRGEATLPILEPIGYDPWSGEGVTAKRVAAALRGLRGQAVTVDINSPGGDAFVSARRSHLARPEQRKDARVRVTRRTDEHFDRSGSSASTSTAP